MARSLASWVALALVGSALIVARPACAESVELRITNVKVTRHQMGKGAAVTFVFARESAPALAAFTAKRVGRVIRILGDGLVLSTPRLMTPIEGGASQVSAPDFKAARVIAGRLRRTGRIVLEDAP